MTFYEWLLYVLATMAADPVDAAQEHPRAAAAVAAARASMVADDPNPAPRPAECVCGGTCRNGVWKPDGRIERPCDCKCERCIKRPGCPDGQCVPGASPATVSPAVPAGRR